MKKVKFKNGYETEMNDDLAAIYLKKGKVELVKEPSAQAPKKPEPKGAKK